MNSTSRTPTVRDYVKVVYRYKLIFILLLAIVLPSTYHEFQLKTPMHMASVIMMIKAQKGTEAAYYQGIMVGKSLNTDLAMLVKSNIVLERVVEGLKLYEYPLDYEKQFAPPLKASRIEERVNASAQWRKDRGIKITPEQLKQSRFSVALAWLNSNVNALPDQESSMFEIRAIDFDPQRAILIANAVSRSYVIFDLEQQIVELRLKYGSKHSKVLQLQAYIEEFSKTLDGKLLPDMEAIGPASVKIIRQARTSYPMGYINKQRNYIIRFFICLIATVVIAFGFELLNQSIRTPYDVELDLGLTCLGSIVKKKSRNKLWPRKGYVNNKEYDKSFQAAADMIYMSIKSNSMKSILITDIAGTRDSLEVITNLSSYFSEQQGLNVLIMDVNLRNNTLSDILDIPKDNQGLSDVVNGNRSFLDAVIEISPHLHVIIAGNAIKNPIDFLQSQGLAEIIAETKKNYDIVFLNGADLRNYGDSVILSDSVDGIVIILNEGEIKKIIAKNAIDQLKQKQVNIVGVILNNRKYVLPNILYKIT